MTDKIQSGQLLRGVGRDIYAVPDDAFRHELEHLPEHMRPRLAFMSPQHHQVRDFVVREIPRESQPLAPGQIANTLGLDERRTVSILADLEKHLFFLVRDAAGYVSWAFPVTTDRTAHRLTFSTGDKTSGA